MAKDAPKEAEVLIGEDWDGDRTTVEQELHEGRSARGFIRLHSSPIARKIVVFNLLALVVLVAGVLFVNPFRDSLVAQREAAIRVEARLIANTFEPLLANVTADQATTETALPEPETGAATDLQDVLANVTKISSSEVRIYDATGTQIAGEPYAPATGPGPNRGVLDNLTGFVDRVFGSNLAPVPEDPEVLQDRIRSLVDAALQGDGKTAMSQTATGTSFLVAVPIANGGPVSGVALISSAEGELDRLVQGERQKILQLFLVAVVVSVGLSLLLASTIANPLADLALAAELGRDRNARKLSPSRVRIPDMTARPDEIGRLSSALRGMVRALYDRIDGNEQFAADVSHEIKNPLASLRSAVGTLRIAKTDEQRTKLLDVIDHDVRRLDRLVSDISNASRLDSELVKEEEESFDLLRMLGHLVEFHGMEASEKGIDFISDMPKEPIVIQGLEGRLAQVFVNLIGNALSFCEEGDAVRVWVRQRQNRVLVVVEDTGPGIPDQALNKVFNRFYSERPEKQFGDHSGLGLAISKQIIEAHGGVIWAENIRPTDADVTSDPLGARFVVGLPV